MAPGEATVTQETTAGARYDIGTDALVSVRGLTKRFGRRTAVDDVSFSIGRGEIFGLLGPNGARERVKGFSGGMKRRLNLALGLLHRPVFLMLDEPTVGVDPQSRERIFDIMRDLQHSGTTLLYTTHYMEEAEQLCDHIAIMD